MSRIVLIGINYAPENIGTGKYTGELGEWLAARGHKVRVITAPPYYPAWKVWPGYRKRWLRRERISGVEVVRCPIWVPRQPHGLTRMLHLASFAFTSLLALAYSLAWRPQLVINIAPTLASAPGAWALARLMRARCWLHIQDFEVDAAMDMGIVHAGLLRRFALATERWLLRRFDRVSTISRRMLDKLTAKGVSPDRQVFFPNWVDTDAIRPLTEPSPYRAELGIPADAVVALYSGNMGLKQGLDMLGEAARALASASLPLLPAREGAESHLSLPLPAGDGARRADGVSSCFTPTLYFVFGGEGPARAMLEQACADLPNVRFLGLQPTERLRDWLGLADIHLLPQRADVADLVMPSKLTGMLASGRAILATALPGTGVAQAVASCGLVTPPGKVDTFVTALRQLTADADLRVRLGQAGRQQALANLSRDAVLNTFEHHLQHLLGKATATPSESGSPSDLRDDP